MDILKSSAELQVRVAQWHAQGKRIGFVPTMGNLHAGHLRLVDVARQHADIVIVSIFVNPTQFGANEDFNRYPRTLEQDCAQLKLHQVDLVYTPDVATMYPNGINLRTYVDVSGIADLHEGASRPGHFRGVATVVAKLFHQVQADAAIFGEKDFQQLLIIRQMVSELNFPIRIVGVPTVREVDGLAMSSRNGYLSPQQRQQAPIIYRILTEVQRRWHTGEKAIDVLQQYGKRSLIDAGLQPDYFVIVSAETLLPPNSPTESLVILVAARLGTTRLIDNLQIGPI